MFAAGIMNAPFEQTEDNFESHFQINYLSHFLLTNLLLPRMKETADTKGAGSCQIVNTSSLAQRSGHINFDELETRQDLFLIVGYVQNIFTKCRYPLFE